MDSKKRKFNLKDEHGAVMILSAVIISVLLGFTALTVDVGMAYHNRTKLQSAADSTALAVVNTLSASSSEKHAMMTNGALRKAVKQQTQKYFETNNVFDFKYDSGNASGTNIEIAPLTEKHNKINLLQQTPDKPAVVIFYKVTPTVRDTPGSSYVEIYAQKHTSTIFGNIFNIKSLKMSVISASKCDTILSGNPAALNYQVVNINSTPEKPFYITGPLENTFIKPVLNVIEKITNTGLDILQNETFLIKYLMGGPTVCRCPNIDCPGKNDTNPKFKKEGYGYIGLEEEFKNFGDDMHTKPYVCPYCRTEIPVENTNKKEVNIITSSAVLNGAIHSNGFAKINIDTIRMRNWQNPEMQFITCDNCGKTGTAKDFQYKQNPDGTVYYKCDYCHKEYNVAKEDAYKIEDNYVIYKNGTKYCLFPTIEVQDFDALQITGSSINDVYLIGNEVGNSGMFPTVRKSGKNDQAKLWDRDERTPSSAHQFSYRTIDPENNKKILMEDYEQTQLIDYMRARFEPRTKGLQNAINVPNETKKESGLSYHVDFTTNPDELNATKSKYDKVLNPYDILRETDLGNGRVLPDAYKIFDDEHKFDWDFDGKVDKIEDLTSGKVTVKEYIDKVGALKKWDITDEDANTFDNARIILDKIVTSYTGEVHLIDSIDKDLSDAKYKKEFYDLFDIDVIKAIETVDKETEGILDNLNSSLNSVTKNYFTPDANPVDDYYNAIKPKYDDLLLTRLQKNSLLNSDVKAQNAIDHLKNKDNKLVSDIITEKGCNGWPEVLPSYRGSVAYFNISAGQKIHGHYIKYDQKSDMEIPSGGSVYMPGYYYGKNFGAFNATRSDLTLKPGTAENPTIMYVGGSEFIPYDNDGTDRRYALKVTGSIYMGDNSILVVNGNMKIDGDQLKMGSNCHIICNGDIYIPNYEKNSFFLGTGSDSGMVDNWTIIANKIDFRLSSSSYAGLQPHCVMYANEVYVPNSDLLNRGLLYVNNNANLNHYITSTVSTEEDKSKNYTSNTYIGNTLTTKKNAYLNGYMVIERKFVVEGDLEAGLVYGANTDNAGGVTVVKGVMRDSNGNETKDISLATSYDTATSINNCRLNHNCRFVVRGPMKVYQSLDVGKYANVDTSGTNITNDERAVLYIDGSKPNADTNGAALYAAYKGADVVNFHERGMIYIKGDVDIRGQNTINDDNGNATAFNGQPADMKYSLVMGNQAYLGVTGNLKTIGNINLKTKALINVENKISVGGDLRVGPMGNDPADIANTKLTGVNAYAIDFTNTDQHNAILHCYNGTVHIETNANPGIIGIDDNAYVYIGSNIGSPDKKLTYIKAWDFGKLFVKGNIYSAGQVGTVEINGDSACQIFVGGDLIADGGVYADGSSDILVSGKITVLDQIRADQADKAVIRVGPKGSIYSKLGIDYKSNINYKASNDFTDGDIEVQYILYSDGDIINTAHKGDIRAGEPGFVRAKNRIEPSTTAKPTINLTRYAILSNTLHNISIIPREPANSVNLTPKGEEAGTPTKPLTQPYMPSQCKSGTNLRISKNTELIVYGDLKLDGYIENYGKIIVFGNITMTSNNATFKNYNLVYCTGDAAFECVEYTNWAFGKHNGLTLQNGSHTDSDARIYVGGTLTAKTSIDNFGKIYVGHDINTTGGLEGCTKYSGWGTGFENGTNSILMLDGTLNTHQGYKSGSLDRPSHTIVKSNSIMYVGKDIITSASLNIGRPKFMESSMESGEEQYKALGTNMYTGLNKPDPYYHVCDKNTPGSIEVDYILPINPVDGHIYVDKVVGKVLDENGNLITDRTYFDKNPKYILKHRFNTYTPNNADFGFVYVKGKVQTGDSNSKSDFTIGYIYNTIVYGKSILFIEGKNLAPTDKALKTGYMYNYPYGRMYVGGNIETVHNDSDFKYKFSESERWRNQPSFTNGNSVELWYYSRTWVNGDLGFNTLEYATYGGRKFVMHDTAKCFINGSCTPREYVEIGRPLDKNGAIDSMDGAIGPDGKYLNNTELQVDGDFTITNMSFKDSYLTLFPRSTLNANGNVAISSFKDLTTDGIRLHHHTNLRAAGKVRAGSINVGSCSNLNVGKDLTSLKSMYIYDKCNVNVGGNGGGDMVSILGKIDIGQHEKEAYKYNTWDQNNKIVDTDITGGNINSGTGEGYSDEHYKNAEIECHYCGAKGSVAGGQFDLLAKNAKGEQEFYCRNCKKTLNETDPIFVDDGITEGSTTLVNGTIKSIFSSLHLFPRSIAYANESIRSYRSITLDKHAGLYVNPLEIDASGILYDYVKDVNKYPDEYRKAYAERERVNNNHIMTQDEINALVVPAVKQDQLLDANYCPVQHFFVETDENSSEYGNIYFLNPKNTPVKTIDPTVDPKIDLNIDVTTTKFFGFSVETIPTDTVPNEDKWTSIFFDPTKDVNEQSFGYIKQADNLYYYDDEGNQLYPYKAEADADGTNITYHYGVSGVGNDKMVVLDSGNDDYIGEYILSSSTTDENGNTTYYNHEINLKAENGTITSYGPLTVDDYATLYSTSNITAYGKTFIGDEGIIYTERGNFRSLKLISLTSAIKGNSVCGFEMEHGTLYAGDNIFILSCADIEGGAIHAIGDITFDSIYVKYLFDPSNPHTDNTKIDLTICSEAKDINFNSLFNVLGGFVYAPKGNLNVNGTYFEHSGAYIGDQIKINAFYIAFHRLPNVSVLDMKWASPGDVYLCEPEG